MKTLVRIIAISVVTISFLGIGKTGISYTYSQPSRYKLNSICSKV